MSKVNNSSNKQAPEAWIKMIKTFSNPKDDAGEAGALELSGRWQV